MLRQRYLVDFGLVLEVFRKYDLVDRGPILRLFLQALLNNHVEVLGDALRDRLVPLVPHPVLQLLDCVCIVGVLMSTHLVDKHAEGPNVRRLRLWFVLPQLGCQVVRRANFLHLFSVSDRL